VLGSHTIILVRPCGGVEDLRQFIFPSTGPSQSLCISAVLMQSIRFASSLLRDMFLNFGQGSRHRHLGTVIYWRIFRSSPQSTVKSPYIRIVAAGAKMLSAAQAPYIRVCWARLSWAWPQRTGTNMRLLTRLPSHALPFLGILAIGKHAMVLSKTISCL